MIHCFDLDGVLLPDVGGAGGPFAYYDREPYEAVAHFVRTLHAAGDHIIIMTARGVRSMGRERAEEFHRPRIMGWLDRHNIPYHELAWKPYADYYYDDKAVVVRGGAL